MSLYLGKQKISGVTIPNKSGGSYTLPVATTETLGGVKIDGSSITIDNGVISSSQVTVDSTLSITSENPVQNKVIYPSLSNFIPKDTMINVKLDGTGDFTKLSDAINYITDKWSNGVVTIKLGEGTFTEAGALHITCSKYNFPKLIIKGSGKDATTISRTGIGSYVAGIYADHLGSVLIEDLTLKIDNSTNGFCLNVNNSCHVELKNINATGGAIGFHSSSIITVRDTTIYATNISKGFNAQNGQIEIWNTTLNFSTVTTAVTAVDGSIIRISGNCTKTFTNVTNVFNTSKNIISTNGNLILAPSSW